MDLDSFLSSPRWEILQIISKKPSSPIEIASKINTTVSFVSQQLKLLEAANILKKERTGSVEKGKPRTLFSLKEEFAYIIPLSKEITSKLRVGLSKENKITLRIWSIKEARVRKIVEKFFWSIEDLLQEIDGIYLNLSEFIPKAYILSKNKTLAQKVKERIAAISQSIAFKVVGDISKTSIEEKNLLMPIYDPFNFFEKNIVKGGEEGK